MTTTRTTCLGFGSYIIYKKWIMQNRGLAAYSRLLYRAAGDYMTDTRIVDCECFSVF